MANTVSIRQFILGLLNREPMSGYDIKRFLKGLSWLIDSPSFGSLYPALHALLEDGLATVEVVPRQAKPPRKIYSITGAGRQVLREWIDQPVKSDAPLKAFVMRLILASNFSHADLIAHLQGRRAQVAAHLERTAGAMNEGLDLGERLALDYGVAVATAELAWLDNTLDRLSQQSSSIETLRGDFAPSTVVSTEAAAR
ncbi:MAG: PadR family transcriptional regulator [Chloroflexi bacterium]|nr:PadR family transcriptional regulator [Chloroflexota bacterium]